RGLRGRAAGGRRRRIPVPDLRGGGTRERWSAVAPGAQSPGRGAAAGSALVRRRAVWLAAALASTGCQLVAGLHSRSRASATDGGEDTGGGTGGALAGGSGGDGGSASGGTGGALTGGAGGATGGGT